MKRLGLLFFFIACSLSLFGFLQRKSGQDESNYIPNRETAIKIAEAVWLPIYGNKIYLEKPFIATLKNNKIWIVEGTLKQQKGGVAYIEIQRSDGKILEVAHGK